MTSTATRSGRTIVRRAAAFARAVGAWHQPDAGVRVAVALIRRGWSPTDAYFASDCVVQWTLRGQTTGKLHGTEPPADDLDVQLLVRRVLEGA